MRGMRAVRAVRERLGLPQMVDVAGTAVFWAAATLSTAGEIAILRSVFITRRTSSESRPPMPHSPRGAEILWGVIPAIGVAILLVATWRAVR